MTEGAPDRSAESTQVKPVVGYEADAELPARDLERYAGLFAQRTKVMKSSAMRDLMALTERRDIISLAGGLPDTSSFPAESFAAIMISAAPRGPMTAPDALTGGS